MSRTSDQPGRREGPRPVLRLVLALALLGVLALALGGALGSLQGVVLTLAPALGLAAMMLTRPYLGERVIARLRARRQSHPHALAARVAARGCPRAPRARGGRLIALALAGRAPPLAPVGCR